MSVTTGPKLMVGIECLKLGHLPSPILVKFALVFLTSILVAWVKILHINTSPAYQTVSEIHGVM